MTRSELARAIVHRATLHGTFTLRSGAVSNVYFDKYLFEADPVLLHKITLQMAPLVPAGVDALAGLEMGGIPLATLLSQHTGLPTLFVRKEAKAYGTCKIAEGGEVKGRRLLLVEDVVTSGGAILDAAKELRAQGAILVGVLCVINRESGGVENLKAADLELQPLFSRSELEAAK